MIRHWRRQAKKETPTALHVSLDTKGTHESRRRRSNRRVRDLDYLPVRDDDNDDDDDEDDDNHEREAE